MGCCLQVEIVNAFSGQEGLKAFKEWVMTPDKDILEAAQQVGRKSSKGKGKTEQPGEGGSQELEGEPLHPVALFARLQKCRPSAAVFCLFCTIQKDIRDLAPSCFACWAAE